MTRQFAQRMDYGRSEERKACLELVLIWRVASWFWLTSTPNSGEWRDPPEGVSILNYGSQGPSSKLAKELAGI